MSLITLVMFMCALKLLIANEDAMKEKSAACMQSSGVDPAIASDAFQGNLADDLNLKNYFRCFFLAMDFQTENGDLNFEKIRTYLDHMKMVSVENPHEALQACEAKNLKGNSPEDTVLINYKCFVGRV